MRKWFFTLGFLLLWVWVVQAQELTVSKVQAGWGNVVKVGAMTPVVVTLENTGSAVIEGQLQLYQMGLSSTIWTQEFRLAAPSRKQFCGYLKILNKRYLTLQVQTKTGQVIQRELELRFVDMKWVNYPKRVEEKLCAVLSPVGTLYVPKLPDGYLGVATTLDFLPLHPGGYESLDLLVINRLSEIPLKSQHKQPLQHWVMTGGVVIFTECYGLDGLPADILRGAVAGEIREPVAGEIRETVRSFPCGKGYVVLLAAPLADSQTAAFLVSALSQTNIVKAKEVNLSSDQRISSFGQYFHGRFSGNIDLLWIVWMLVAYLVIIGPGDYWLVKKLKKPVFTWVTFSGAIIVFSAFAYAHGTWLRAGPMRLGEVHLLDLFPHAQQAVGQSFFAIYSTRNADYSLHAEPAPALLSPYASSSDDCFLWQQGENSRMRVRIPIYSNKAFSAIWRPENPLTVDYQTTPMHQGWITLPENLKVQEGWFVVSRDAVFSLAADSTFQVPGKQRWLVKETFPNSLSSLYEGRPQQLLEQCCRLSLGHHSSGDSRLEYAEERLNWGPLLDRNYGIFLLQLATPLQRIVLEGESPETEGIHLIRVLVPLKKGN